MTKTEAIIISDKAEAKGSELREIARYLVRASDKERESYLRRNPRVAQALASL